MIICVDCVCLWSQFIQRYHYSFYVEGVAYPVHYDPVYALWTLITLATVKHQVQETKYLSQCLQSGVELNRVVVLKNLNS